MNVTTQHTVQWLRDCEEAAKTHAPANWTCMHIRVRGDLEVHGDNATVQFTASAEHRSKGGRWRYIYGYGPTVNLALNKLLARLKGPFQGFM